MSSNKAHHRREIFFLLTLLVVFSLVFLMALLDILRKTPVFGIGLSYTIENSIIIALSFLAILKIIWHIIIH